MNTDSVTTAVLTAVRRAVDETTPVVGADAGLPQVLTAARARRRRRRVTAYGGAAGAGLAVSAALTLALGAPGAGPRVNPGGTTAQAGMTGAANPAGTSRGTTWATRRTAAGRAGRRQRGRSRISGLGRATSREQVEIIAEVTGRSIDVENITGESARDLPRMVRTPRRRLPLRLAPR